jgi:hypothetical protein
MKETTRREVQWLTPLILGQFHDLIMKNDLSGFEELLAKYPHIPEVVRGELIADFKRIAEDQLRRRLRAPR